MAHLSIRSRLAIWYMVLVAASLLLFGLLLYLLMAAHLYQMIDDSLLRQGLHATEGISWRADSPQVPDVFNTEGSITRLLKPDGTSVTGTGSFPPALTPHAQQLDEVLQQKRLWVTIVDPGTGMTYRNLFLTLEHDQSTEILQIATTYTSVHQALDRLKFYLTLGSLVILLVGGTIGWIISGKAFEPVATMTETARAIAVSQGFDRRIQVQNPQDEMGRLAMTFNEMLASLEEAYAIQKRFVGDASHELRAPLTTIKGNIHLLKQNHLPTEDREAILQDVEEEVDRLGRLVKDLLDLARADAGQLLPFEPVELDHIMMNVFKRYRTSNHDITYTIKHIEPVTIEGDAERVKELILNLLDNASRYTPTGGRVNLELRGTPSEAVIIVADTGIGIDPNDIPHIFDRFFRADKARSRTTGGTGLGLAIVKWIVDAHGGDIVVDSSPGEGTTFTVKLPRPQLAG